MNEAFILTLKDCLNGTNEELDNELEESWNIVITKFKKIHRNFFSYGIQLKQI